MIETAAPAVISEAALLEALRPVYDPELDESLVELGFLDGVHAEGGAVHVRLRLPTFWCAPNFAYLMADDARQRLLAVPGVRQVHVTLRDNAYAEEISRGVSAGQGFSEVFPGQAEGDDLGALRRLFADKAFGMRQEQLVRFLLDQAGLAATDVVALRVGDVLDATDATGLRLRLGHTERLLRGGAPLARLYLDRRRRLGLPHADAALLMTDVDGAAIAADDLPGYLQRGRRQRISMTFNRMLCRGLLETRYGLDGEEGRGNREGRRGDEGCPAL